LRSTCRAAPQFCSRPFGLDKQTATPQAAVRWISASWWLRTAPQSSTRAGH